MGAPQRLRMAEWLLVYDLEGTFRLDSTQWGEDFSERARNQKSQPPRMPLLRWT